MARKMNRLLMCQTMHGVHTPLETAAKGKAARATFCVGNMSATVLGPAILKQGWESSCQWVLGGLR